jgi:hypothetical protein
MKPTRDNFARELRFAKSLYGDLSKSVLRALRELIQRHQISVTNGDVKYLDGGWYVTHSPSDAAAPASTAVLSWNLAIPGPLGGSAEPPFSSRGHVRDSSATAMPIRPMCLPCSTGPRCGWLRPGRSTEPCARPTASASARSRKIEPVPSSRDSKKAPLSLCRFLLGPPGLGCLSGNFVALFGGQLAPSRVAP